MNNQEIMAKVVEKLIVAGWNWRPFTGWEDDWAAPHDIVEMVMHELFLYVPKTDERSNKPDYKLRSLIYDHEVAKILWGEDWQSHLQQMVVADEPIKYLGAHI